VRSKQLYIHAPKKQQVILLLVLSISQFCTQQQHTTLRRNRSPKHPQIPRNYLQTRKHKHTPSHNIPRKIHRPTDLPTYRLTDRLYYRPTFQPNRCSPRYATEPIRSFRPDYHFRTPTYKFNITTAGPTDVHTCPALTRGNQIDTQYV